MRKLRMPGQTTWTPPPPLQQPVVDRQLLRTLRDEMKRVVNEDDAPGALALCRQIRSLDLLIAAPPPPVNYLKRITMAHAGMCQECLIAIPIGTVVLWQESVGVWHPRCLGQPDIPLLDGQ